METSDRRTNRSRLAASPPVPLRAGLQPQWLLDDRIAFLNHGSFGAVPRCVLEEQTEWRRRIEAEPVEILARQLPELLAKARRPIGAWLGMEDSDFGFVTNATEGINAVLRSLELHEGDELLTTTHVYNAVRQAMRFVAGRAGASYRELDIPLPVNEPGEIRDAVLAALTPRTRLLVIDHITSPTALVFPIDPIVAACAERGVEVLIDGAHGPGMVPLNVAAIGAAYYAGNLHKWACGPKGSAFLWVRRDRQKATHPLVVSHFLDEGFTREFNWQGTRDVSAWLSVPRALEFFADLGWDRVMDHNQQLAVWRMSFSSEDGASSRSVLSTANCLGRWRRFRCPRRSTASNRRRSIHCNAAFTTCTMSRRHCSDLPAARTFDPVVSFTTRPLITSDLLMRSSGKLCAGDGSVLRSPTTTGRAARQTPKDLLISLEAIEFLE